MKMESKPLVSVCMIAFNHERFIEEAIDGVLSQRVSFPIELVIGDDRSTDDTKRICEEYKKQHPFIRLLDRPHNLGMQRNFMETLRSCQGKYIALCEGDDFWTDPDKLEEQVAFLETHQDFAVCHHRVRILDESQRAKRALLSSRPATDVTTFEELARKQHIQTVSCVFRNKLFDFPEDFFLSVYGTDYALNLLNAYHGKIKFLDKVMGVYRIHDQGEWSGRPSIERSTKAVDTIRRCSEHFYPRAAAEFEYHRQLMTCLLDFEKRDFHQFRTNFKKLWSKSLWLFDLRTLCAVTARYFVSWLPSRFTRVRDHDQSSH
jgi:glycosyltransferase involved in cell wall biosynthesis